MGSNNLVSDHESTIVTTETTEAYDAGTLGFFAEKFAFADMDTDDDGKYYVELEHAPYADGSVHVSYGTGEMNPDVDYSIEDARVTLEFVPEAGEILLVHYMAYVQAVEEDPVPVDPGFVIEAPTPGGAASPTQSITVQFPNAYQPFYAFLVGTAVPSVAVEAVFPNVSGGPGYWDERADGDGQYTFAFDNTGGANPLSRWLVVCSAGRTAISANFTLAT